MGGLSLWHWLIVLVIVVLVFGTKRLKNVGQDLGEAVKGFKKGINDHDKADADKDGKPPEQLPDARRDNGSDDVAARERRDDVAARPRDDDDRTPPASR